MAKKKALPDWVKNPPEGYIVAKSDPNLIRATSRKQAKDRLQQQFKKGRSADKGGNVDVSGLHMDRYFTSDDGTTYVLADTQGVKFRSTLPESANESKGTMAIERNTNAAAGSANNQTNDAGDTTAIERQTDAGEDKRRDIIKEFEGGILEEMGFGEDGKYGRNDPYVINIKKARENNEPHRTTGNSVDLQMAIIAANNNYKRKYGHWPPSRRRVEINETEGGRFEAVLTIDDPLDALEYEKSLHDDRRRKAFTAVALNMIEEDAGAAKKDTATKTSPEALERIGAGRNALQSIAAAANGDATEAKTTTRDTSVRKGFDNGSRVVPEVTTADTLDAAVEGDSLQTILGPTATAAEKLKATQKIISELSNYENELSNLDPNARPERQTNLLGMEVGPWRGPRSAQHHVTPTSERFDASGTSVTDPNREDILNRGGRQLKAMMTGTALDPTAVEGGGLPGHSTDASDPNYVASALGERTDINEVASPTPLVFRPAEGSVYDERIRELQASENANKKPHVPVTLEEDELEDSAEPLELDLEGMEPPPELRYTEPQAWDETAKVEDKDRLPYRKAFDRSEPDKIQSHAEEQAAQQEPKKRYRKGLGGGATAHAHRRLRGRQPENLKLPDFRPAVSGALKSAVGGVRDTAGAVGGAAAGAVGGAVGGARGAARGAAHGARGAVRGARGLLSRLGRAIQRDPEPDMPYAEPQAFQREGSQYIATPEEIDARRRRDALKELGPRSRAIEEKIRGKRTLRS